MLRNEAFRSREKIFKDQIDFMMDADICSLGVYLFYTALSVVAHTRVDTITLLLPGCQCMRADQYEGVGLVLQA